MELTATVGERPDDDEWLALTADLAPGEQFLTPAWFTAWEHAFLGDASWHGAVRHLVVRGDGTLLGVLPLSKQRILAMSLLALPGYFLPFRGVPIRGDAVDATARAMVQTLTRTGGGVGLRVGPLSTDSRVPAALVRELTAAGWSVIELPRGHLMTLALPRDPQAYRGMVRGRAKKADYFLRKMKRAGDVRIELHTEGDSAGAKRLLGQLRQIESQSWVARAGSPRFMGERNEAFWTCLLDQPEFRRALRTWVLYFENDPVSFCMTMDAGSGRFQLVNGYTEEVRRHSTGHIVFKQMIDDAIAGGLAWINFGQGDPGHKSEWAAEPRARLVDVVAMRPGIFGAAAVWGYNLLNAIKERRRRAATEAPSAGHGESRERVTSPGRP